MRVVPKDGLALPTWYGTLLEEGSLGMAAGSGERRVLEQVRSPSIEGRVMPSPRSLRFWIERLVGLGLVLAGLVLFYGMTIPSLMGPWYCTAILGVIALGGAFLGLPLLVTGRVRQPR